MRSSRPLTGALLTAAALTTVALVTSVLGPGAPDAAGDERGPLVWSDEFDGPAGSAPSPDRWRTETGGGGWGNSELQLYTDSTRNAALDGQGHLVITARAERTPGASCWYGQCAYTSARLITAGKFETTYGHVEARIRIPSGQGTWPAFWMLGSDIFTTAPWPASGEIDVMENVGHEPGRVWGSLHLPGHSGADALNGSYDLPGGGAFSDDFHVYAVDWSPGAIVWSVDGVEYERRTPADGGGSWPFDHPFFLLLNLAVGGGWPGSPDATTTFPQQMVVDHVRAYAPGVAPPASATRVVGLGGRCLDLPWGDTRDGVPIEMHDCAGWPNQQWTFGADGTVRTLGACLDVAWGSHADGAAVQIARCTGSSAQQFDPTSSGEIVNRGSGKCLDVVDHDRSEGARVQQWSCAGSENQRWTRG